DEVHRSPPVDTFALTTVHQYGSSSPFQRIETKFGLRRGGTHRNSRKINFVVNPGIKRENLWLKAADTNNIMAAVRPFHHQAGAQGTHARRSAHRSVRPRPWHGGRPRKRAHR